MNITVPFNAKGETVLPNLRGSGTVPRAFISKLYGQTPAGNAIYITGTHTDDMFAPSPPLCVATRKTPSCRLQLREASQWTIPTHDKLEMPSYCGQASPRMGDALAQRRMPQ